MAAIFHAPEVGRLHLANSSKHQTVTTVRSQATWTAYSRLDVGMSMQIVRFEA